LIPSSLIRALERSFAGILGLAIVSGAALGYAQNQPPSQPPLYGGSTASVPPQQQSGSATGGVFAPVLDSEKRPITAGGFVKDGPVIFKDISAQAGLTVWRHKMGTPEKPYILETIGSGVCLLDYDHDGWLDIYLVNGSTYDAETGKTEPPHAALFHNNHDGTFTNVANIAGVTNDRWGFGCAVGDYDNDGWPDLYVGNYGKNRLYHNNHDGTFTDVAEAAGVTLGNWSTGPSFGDYDSDGQLDIFVPGYVHWDMNHLPLSGSKAVGYANCQFRGAQTMCGPRGLQGEPDHLFHNNGDGTFTDVSEKAGVSDKRRYYGFSSTFVDINNDGKVDLVVTDDSSPNYLYINKGDGTFEDTSFYSGFALNQDARETASMGLAVGDYTNNGRLDLYTTTFSDDYKTLYRNDGEGNFTDITPQMRIAEPTYPFLSWGTEFFDYDNDGWKDLMFVAGHVYPVVDQHDWGTSWAERPLLFHNLNHGKKFEVMPAVEGTGLADVLPARGAAFGDLFNDGKIDVVINCIDHTPVLLRNVNDDHNHWVGLLLIGGPRSPRDAVGSTVYLTASGARQRGDVMSGGSFESSNDFRLHYGLGEATTVDKVEIRWPDGQKETVALPGVDRYFAIEEGKGLVRSVYDTIAPDRAKSKSSGMRAGK
jgi:enediyne biosynthesis protein E4